MRIHIVIIAVALCLGGCGTTPVQTQTIQVPGPTRFVAVPDSCLLPIPLPDPVLATNGNLLQYAGELRGLIEQANAQIDCVRELQPR